MESQRYECRLGDMKITLIERKWHRSTRSNEFYAAPRMYVNIKDETVYENLLNRRQRPYNAYKTLIHGSMLNQVLNLTPLKWSQHAGCTCNCSPGFILPHQHVSIGSFVFRNFDVWLSFEGASVPAVRGELVTV